ncbi:MAG: hypothetical protein ACYTG5_01085 [Planctomycetota bacterium]|jgi:hypothetical protein
MSRLVCSVLLLATAVSPQKPLEERISKALDKARPAVAKYLREGRSGELALICLAAIHDGMDSRDRDLAKALTRLSKSNLSGTYETSLRLMVLAHRQDIEERDEIAGRDAEALINRQTGSGGFSYYVSRDNWDLSNTQYAALGLRAAASMGIEVPQSTWLRLLDCVAEAQKENGGFCYVINSPAQQATASMTVAGIAVLEICLQHLELDEQAVARIRAGIDKAWEWMAKNKYSIGLRNQRWCLYYHYGLERAAVLSDVSDVDGVDWYAEGSEMILKLQRRTGAFMDPLNTRRSRSGRRGSLVDTAFSVLFLRRAFRRTLEQPITPGPGYFCLTLPTDATADEIDRAARNDTGRGIKAIPDLLKCMRGNILTRRKAAAIAIVKITAEDFGYHPYRSAEDNTAALRAIEGWWLKNRNR